MGEHNAMTPPPITDPVYALTPARGQAEAQSEFRALAVRYVPGRAAIEVQATQIAGCLVPRLWNGALQDVPVEALTQLEIWPDGSAIELDAHNIHISVH